MQIVSKFVIASILCAALTGCAHNEAPAKLNTSAIEQANIKNLQMPEKDIFVSGQPTKEQIQILAKAGIKHIINLRVPSEINWDEEAFVKSLGMQYHSIPVAGLAGITTENAQRLHQLLDSLQTEPILVHCASGNRIGALITVYEAEIQGNNIDAAVSEGKRWGLTKAEAALREKLSKK